MSGIKRIGWHGVHGMQDDANGDYVLHSDHEAEVARLRAEIEENEKAINVWRGRTQRAEAEVQAYRKDAERYRWLRDQAPWSDSKNPCPYSEQEDGQLRCITAGLDDKIDAAMGASA